MGHFINSTKIGHESYYMSISGHKFREGGGLDRHQSLNFRFHRHKVCFRCIPKDGVLRLLDISHSEPKILEQIDVGCPVTSLSWSPNYRSMALGSSKVLKSDVMLNGNLYEC